MSNEQAQKLIILATLITIGSTTANVLRKPKKQHERLKEHRVLIGGFFAMVGCSLLAEANPTIGVGIAAMVSGRAFFKYGLPVLEESIGNKEGEQLTPGAHQEKGAKGKVKVGSNTVRITPTGQLHG